MKRLTLTALSALMLGGTAAVAYTDAPQPMVDEVRNVLDKNGYSDVPVELLNDRQIAQIFLATSNSDGGSQQREEIAAILPENIESLETEEPVMIVVPAQDTMTVTVQNYLDENGYKADVDALELSQIASIYAQITADNSPSETERFVRDALSG
ncbi:hypothetical protein Ga0609869_002327 [Rhodovulum iodosum]|uniref:DUF302 domain-containing protein n=1 Tax=Rhodovulum iodosum TaxID=68291 RepID=A0ABV3XV60_9RHOB|nr:hypothetical protein [Rhodovulum robiginosum]RSK35027.1 hypothetical protein EJA01_06405 [Rhodovulum robiginosum]